MQNTPQQPPRNRIRLLLDELWRIVRNNLGFKVLALVIAILLWAALITQDPNLTREKVFQDVKISLSGEETIKRNGLIVVNDLSSQLEDAQLRVDVPQLKYNAVSAGNYNVRVDLSRITEKGTQEVKVLSTSSSVYGSVSEISPSSIMVEVEEYITRYRIPVNVTTIGKAPEGYYAGTAQPDPPMVAVSGPKSLVERIVQADAVLDLSHLPAREGNVRTAAPFYLLDESGYRVESNLLSVTSESVLLDSVVVEQSMYSMKSMVLSSLELITGTPAEGYEVKSVVCEPDIVLAAGRAINLELLDTLYANAPVDVTGRTESFQQQVKVRRPTELVYLSADSVTIEVEIGPVIRPKELANQRINLLNLEDGLHAALSAKTALVTITGPQLWVKDLKSSHITLTCNAAGLAAGEYDLPIMCTVQNDGGQTYSVDLSPSTVHVTITEK